MKRTSLALAAMFLLIAVFGSACGGKNNEEPTGTVSPYAGYALGDEARSGGTEIADANAKLITMEEKDGESVVTIKFVIGSQFAGDESEAAATAVPAYRAYALSAPARLVVEFTQLSHWDYSRISHSEQSTLVMGIFNQLEDESERFRIYFQLGEEIAFKAEEKQDQLVLTLKPVPKEETDAYYITLNAFAQSVERLPMVSELNPTLCDDLVNTILISKPFGSQEDAELYQDELIFQDIYKNIPLDKWDSIILKGNSLPIYNAELDYHYVASKAVARKDGALVTLPVIMPDGLFLSESPAGTLLFSKTGADAHSDDAETSEYLWLLEPDGRQKPLTDFEFAGIVSAEFSPDGKRLAILDQLSESTYLYVYDLDSGELLNLGEEGFGNQTVTFIWDSLGTTIFAISGNAGQSQELHCYDFTIPDESKRHYAVSDYEIAGDALGFANGYIYFTNTQADNSVRIYRIRPEGGAVDELTTGADFVLTPDGKHMIILAGSSDESSESDSTLKLYDITMGTERSIVSSAGIFAFGLSSDGKTLYFIESDEIAIAPPGDDDGTDDGTDESEQADTEEPTPEPAQNVVTNEYPFILKAYDMQTGAITVLVDLISSEVHTAPRNQLYMHYLDSTGAQPFRSTYLITD